ncbi:hypothetical protein [Streptomyces sp. Isolate_219]|uniref:hypothetical protein n=1 Tax=Streptomyces sp. Isolate_219 TaxID=2950110 RepID=UPI0021C690A5|nr:hypothetical protein [Streptomyces sp. Isolate_219]MCR8576444.1 hypothetical protein [Streptomyces sp. Isolate_219]
MTVAELIAKLQRMPQDASVTYEGHDVNHVTDDTDVPNEAYRAVDLTEFECCDECG